MVSANMKSVTMNMVFVVIFQIENAMGKLI